MAEQRRSDDIFDRLPVALYRKSADGRFLRVNARLVNLLKYPDPASLLQLDSRDLFLHAADHRRWQETMEGSGLVDRLEVPLRTGRGDIVWCEESAQAIYDGRGELLHYEGVLTDISDRKVREQIQYRCDGVLDALAQISQQALADGRIGEVMQHALARIGQSLEVERVQVVEYAAGSEAQATRQIHSWSAPGMPAELSELTWMDGSPAAPALERWPELLRAGEIIAGPLTPLPAAEQAYRTTNGILSLAVVPIFCEGVWWGFLELDAFRQERQWAPAELDVLRTAAGVLGTTIESARFYDSVVQRLAQETALSKASSLISSKLDLELVLEQITREMGEAIGATSAYICRYDAVTNISTVLAEYIGPEASPAEQVSDLGATYLDKGYAFAKALMAGQHTISHLGDDDLSIEETSHLIEYDAKSVLYIPLLVFGELLGFAEIWESRHRRQFTQPEINICLGIAQSAAVAITNARLFAAERRQLQLSRTLQRVGALLTTRLDLGQVFEKIFDLLQQVIEFDSASIQLRDEQGQMYMAASRGLGDQTELRQLVDSLGDDLSDRLSVDRPLEVMPDTRVNEERQAEPGRPPVASWIGAALLIQDRMIGTLNIESLTPNVFDQTAGETVMAFANQAAVAIENARLYEELQLRASELAVLHKVALAAAQTVDWHTLLWQTTETLAGSLYPDHFGFLLYDFESGQLRPHASYFGIGLDGHKTVIPLDNSVAGRVLLTGLPCLLRDVSQDDAYYEVTPASRSEITVPLTVQNKVIGVINAESPQPAAFDENDLSFLTTLAGQVATAIERVQLYQAQQSYIAHLAQEVNVRTAQLQAERDRIQAILDNAGEGIFFTDPDGEILYVNPAMANVVGFPAAQLLNQTPLLWLGESESGPAFQEMWAAVQMGHGWRGELASRSSDDRPTDLFLTIAPINTMRGSLAGFVGVLSDISRLKEVERLKTQFVSNISHELRTPLTNIETYVTLLLRGKPERREHYLQVISNETRRLSRLINGILELSRLEIEPLSPVVKPVDLPQVIEAVLDSFSFQFERRRIQLRCDIPAELPAVSADADQLGSVVTNLISNAMLYTAEGDEVVVSAGTGLWQNQQQVWCRVADNGSGIYPEDLPRLFDRFYRGRGALEQGVPGTGLGLSISKEIIDRHGGHITVESNLEHGSRFTFWLPIAGH